MQGRQSRSLLVALAVDVGNQSLHLAMECHALVHHEHEPIGRTHPCCDNRSRPTESPRQQGALAALLKKRTRHAPTRPAPCWSVDEIYFLLPCKSAWCLLASPPWCIA